MQIRNPKTFPNAMIFSMEYFALRNSLFGAAIWPVSEALTCCMGSSNGTFRNALNINGLAQAGVAIVINIIMLTAMPAKSLSAWALCGYSYVIDYFASHWIVISPLMFWVI